MSRKIIKIYVLINTVCMKYVLRKHHMIYLKTIIYTTHQIYTTHSSWYDPSLHKELIQLYLFNLVKGLFCRGYGCLRNYSFPPSVSKRFIHWGRKFAFQTPEDTSHRWESFWFIPLSSFAIWVLIIHNLPSVTLPTLLCAKYCYITPITCTYLRRAGSCDANRALNTF